MTDLDEKWLQAVAESGVSVNVTVEHGPVCCCRNDHKPLDGFIYTDSGCRIHGVFSNIGARSKH